MTASRTVKRSEAPMDRDRLAAGVLDAWRRNNGLLLTLLDQISTEGLEAVPTGSKGRTVAAQLIHLDRVRQAWAEYHLTGRRIRPPRYDKSRPPTRSALRAALGRSGKTVETTLARALAGEIKIRMFGGHPVRWLAYLIAHESHHRGQILLALKQNDMRIGTKVSIDALWGGWIFGPMSDQPITRPGRKRPRG